MFQPLTFEEADSKADSVLALMTLEEKIAYVGGDKSFFLRGIPRLRLEEVYLADATQGIHIRESFGDIDLSEYQPEQSTAFPAPILLASTWNTQLAHDYAEAVGQECRAGGIGVLLGPGLNSYRHSQCGRNFEYFGEDPCLRSRMIESYVKGVQGTGTIATLKHFVANNTEYYRRRSNSVVDDRTLHEIYLPPFKAGIDAGAKAVMTAYNQLNGEWCGQSKTAISEILRKGLGFQWLVMTDWWSVDDGKQLAASGQDLEMPHAIALADAQKLIDEGTVQVEDINRMAKSILRTYFAMKLDGERKDTTLLSAYPDHESIALQTAREGIVLLKNNDAILPIREEARRILLTGPYVDNLARGGGSAEVEGYNHRLMIDELKKEFGNRLMYVEHPTTEEIAAADIVLCNVGTMDREGFDRPFELPTEQEELVTTCVSNNRNTVVIVTSGSGIRMTGWNDKVKAVIYAWYVGQNGNTALAEILSGKTNPSGKLPITIEREFMDSPGSGFLPKGESLYVGWDGEQEKAHPVYDVRYDEGIFVGYRWFEKKRIDPLYPFGHGLSYATFAYGDLHVSKDTFGESETVTVEFSVTNEGTVDALEIAQVYIEDAVSSLPRPAKELKRFAKIHLAPGQTRLVAIQLNKPDFSFYSPAENGWIAEPGDFIIHIGSSSRDIRLTKQITLRL